ncbi:MAG: hypothetical protein SWH61_05395 [Thermodesulfobacteriota bacterium]|nr:hypothetical protein [Thermodesulfobacteriota bacterium]
MKIRHDVFTRELPVPEVITEKTKDATRKNALRFRGSVRISTGRFFTTKEYEERRRRILNTPLP